MIEQKDFSWFKMKVESVLKKNIAEYTFFTGGDFGSLDRIEINSTSIGIEIDVWALNWLGIFIWDYIKEIEILNVLLEPSQEAEKEHYIAKLLQIINENNL